MKVKMASPVRYVHGALDKDSDTYFRVQYGEQVMQRKPSRASEKQRAWRKEFARRYAGKRG